MSYLPYNRGAHPNFWSFIENSPKGVAIHEINEGIDTGDIIFRKKFKIDNKKNKFSTFKKTYNYLFQQLESLFINKFKFIIDKNYSKVKQSGISTFHTKDQLPKILKNWNTNIDEFKKNYFKSLR